MTFQTSEKNADQIAFWNGPGGELWVRRQAIQDVLLAPVMEQLNLRAAAKPGERVIDIGCGCGATTIALGRAVAPGGRVIGIDVSAEMLAAARQKVTNEPVTFVHADATVFPFETASTDLLFSRFGVMFFADPVVSFGNLRRALQPRGRLAFACWQQPKKNGWLMMPLAAAYKHVPRLPQLGPDDPGPFSFSDPARVERILTGAGFSSVTLEPHDLEIDIAAGRGLDGAVAAALELGPTARAIEGHGAETVAAVRQSIREALQSHEREGRIPLPAAIWIVTASA